MAWEDVPAKLAQYAAEDYAPTSADLILLAEFDALSLDEVAETRRDEFEASLDYRLGACVNLRTSKAVKPS